MNNKTKHGTLGDYVIKKYGRDFLSKIWSDKNEKTPFEFATRTKQLLWFRCPNGLHEDFQKSGDNAFCRNYKCKKCSIIEQHNQQRSDYIGKRFGRLVVTEFDRESSENSLYTFWFCDCDCGTIHIRVRGWDLATGNTKSCGCLKHDYVGENHHNWKGGVTSNEQKIRVSNKYNSWREAIFNYDDYTCQCCGQRGGKLNAHHIFPFAEYKELRLDINNGITLCESCHAFKNFGSFHNLYGTHNNTPEQLEEYINKKRNQLGIIIPFNIKKYRQGDILSPILF